MQVLLELRARLTVIVSYSVSVSYGRGVRLATIFYLPTVEFSIPTTIFGERPYLSGGLLGDFYEAMAVHFHWGSPQQKGSEHLLNGRRYDLEMHIVHRNTRYQSDEEARNQTDGLAVLAVLFKVVRVSSDL